MKFHHVKEDQQCKGCNDLIMSGEEAVVIRMKVNGGMELPFAFHPQCYLDWNAVSFMNRLHRWTMKERKPRKGRPRKYKNYLKADRISGLLYYYKKCGNQAKIAELTEELDKQRISTGNF